MVTSLIRLGMLAALIAAGPSAAATFDYHGTLNDGGRPADGNYDLQLTLYASAQGGKVIAGPLTLYAVPVHGGSFSTRVDFGAMADVGDAWLAASVREAGRGEFAALPGRSEVAATTTSVCPGAWTLFGNAGTTPATPAAPASGNYLGTADAQPLVIEVDGKVAGRIIPTSQAVWHDAPTIVLGSPVNSTIGDRIGATVSGGGSSNAECGPFGIWSCANIVDGDFGTVAGGIGNYSAKTATVAGGANNQAGSWYSAIGGGLLNSAFGLYSVVGGGNQNIAGSFFSVVPGGQDNSAGGDFSLAAGHRATVRDLAAIGGGSCTTGTCGDYGTFVWADSQNSNFTSTGPNQFLVRAAGGVAINGTPNDSNVEFSVIANGNAGDYSSMFVRQSSQPAGILMSAGEATQGSNNAVFYLDQYDGSNQYRLLTLSSYGFTGINGATPDFSQVFVVGTNGFDGSGAYLTPGGEWTNASSRHFKEDFAAVDAAGILAKVLALPVRTWFYRNDHREGRHLGPVAEEFSASFGLGNDDRYIATGDESGVALAAIQGLNDKQESDSAALRRESAALRNRVESDNATLQRENAELKSRLDEVMVRLAKLEARGL